MSPRPLPRPEATNLPPIARRAPAGLGSFAALVLLFAICLSGCNWLTGPRSQDQPRQGIILKVDRHKAALYINDHAITLLSARKPNVIGLEPGKYRVAVKKAGYFTRYFDVRVASKRFEHLEARLPPELD
ncbi:MAG: hypothetical protein RBU30_17165 [Polyangia bacterium]|jgi:hypothetical protein|nr:hypothetical protein [Polyangia bacterium]